MFTRGVRVTKFICNQWRIVVSSIRRVLGASCRFEENELIVTRQIGHELHDTDSSGTAHTVVRYGTQLMSSTAHTVVTYIVMSMPGHGLYLYRVQTCHVKGYVRSYVTNNAYDVL